MGSTPTMASHQSCPWPHPHSQPGLSPDSQLTGGSVGAASPWGCVLGPKD